MSNEIKNTTSRKADNDHQSKSSRHKYLIFQIDEEQFGFSLNQVKEVIGVIDIRSIPDTPQHLKGLINLRGLVIPVIDLRLKFHINEKEYLPKKTSIIIVEIGKHSAGVIVDTVKSVENFDESDIDSEVDLKEKVYHDFITGIAKCSDEKLILLVDVNKVLLNDKKAMEKIMDAHESEDVEIQDTEEDIDTEVA